MLWAIWHQSVFLFCFLLTSHYAIIIVDSSRYKDFFGLGFSYQGGEEVNGLFGWESSHSDIPSLGGSQSKIIAIAAHLTRVRLLSFVRVGMTNSDFACYFTHHLSYLNASASGFLKNNRVRMMMKRMMICVGFTSTVFKIASHMCD